TQSTSMSRTVNRTSRSTWPVILKRRSAADEAAGKCCSAVAHDLVFDAVGVEEVEASAGLVVGVPERLQPCGDHALLGRPEVVDLDADVVERLSLGEIVGRVGDAASRVQRDVVVVGADVDGVAAVARLAAPALMPAEQVRHEPGGA